MKTLVTRFVLLGCFLLSAVASPAQEKKTPTLRDAVIGIAGSVHDAKIPVFTAPELKPISDKLPAAFKRSGPESVADLKAIQDHVAKVVEQVSPAVVCVRVGSSTGSGVIVSKDGYILTAGHVSGKPDRDVVIIFHNRTKSAKGKTLGGNHGIDSGMIKITDDPPEGGWPVADMGDSATLEKGDWCMVIAHPGGFKRGRTPPVRLGRLLSKNDSTLTTDCILVGGDSGGPLFDMHGRVVGINSRIAIPLTANMHVPVNPFRDNWGKIAKNEVWGGKLGGATGKLGIPDIGVKTDRNADGCVIASVTAGSPAEKAGLKANDLILKVDSREVPTRADLQKLLQSHKAGDQVTVEIRRGEETLTLKIEIGKR
jgi:serine protease Do